MFIQWEHEQLCLEDTLQSAVFQLDFLAHLWHGNQRWWVGVLVKLFAFIRQTWEMF